MGDGYNCQLFIEMHNFFNYKIMSVLISASGLSLCSMAPGEELGKHQSGVFKVYRYARFPVRFLYPCTSLGHPYGSITNCSALQSGGQRKKLRWEHLLHIWTKMYGKESQKNIKSLFYVRCCFVSQPLSQKWVQTLKNISG